MPSNAFLQALPKAEVHLHIEGTLRPERLLDRARRHRIDLAYKTQADVEAAYSFESLEDFLELYYRGCDVLRDADDFYLLARDYFEQCRRENIVHVEVGFDPQAHLARGIAFDEVMAGLTAAIDEARGSSKTSILLVMNIMRDRPPSDALDILEESERWADRIAAVGLDSAERDFPPALFAQVFERAADWGYRLTAHAGEEGTSDFVWSALDDLGVARIDHGVRAEDDPSLIRHLAAKRIGLTVCPVSNVALRVFPEMAEHNILRLLEAGVCVSVNSDDPAYFNGYLTDNYLALRDHLGMTRAQAVRLAIAGFEMSFADPQSITRWTESVTAFDAGWSE